MKVAGRKMAVSMSMPVRPGCISAIASSTPRVTSRVLAQGSFSTISISPGPPLITASPKSGQVSQTTSPTSFRINGEPSVFLRSLIGIWASSSGVMTGRTERMPSLWLGVSIKPPVPITEPSEYCSSPTSRASAVTSITSVSGTSYARIWFRLTCTAGILILSPQMGTLATPGTSSRRARIFQ